MLKHNVRVKMLSNPKYFELTVSITHLVFQRNVKVFLLYPIGYYIVIYISKVKHLERSLMETKLAMFYYTTQTRNCTTES